MTQQKAGLLPNLAINRPITVIMTLIALLVVGYIAFTQIAVELMPAGFSPPFLGVWVPYPNSNPQEVEEQIAKKVEEQIQTISGVRSIRSWSHSNGCWTFIEFAQDTDMDLAYAHLRDRMDRVKSEIPEDIERIYVRKWNEDDDPIIWAALIEKEPQEDSFFLVEQYLQKPVEQIDGVAKVEIWGADEKSILIHINQDRVKTYKINLYDIIQRLRSDNFAISSGYVTEGDRKIYVRSVGKFKSLQEIQNIPLGRPNLYLKDVAEIKYDVPERQYRNLMDGKPAIGIGIFKESMANTVDLTQRVLDEFEERIKKDPRLSGFEVQILFNQGEFILESIDNLQNAALWGGFFAFIVLYFFLRRFRMTIIVNLAIPLSVLITLTVLYFVGWTLNLVTMMGLMISIGMVVDNSIVVLENIYRKRTTGEKDPKRAALYGTSEVGLAVTMATMTTVVVFLPLILMNDEIGFKFYMMRIGIPVMISLVASLFVSMVFIPLAATRLVSSRQVKEAAAITAINRGYQRMLSWSLNHRVETFIILMLLIFSMNWASSQIESVEGMEGNINDFRIFFEMPENYTLDDAERLLRAVEDTINTKKELYGVRTINTRFRHNWGRINVFLKKQEMKQWYETLYENTMIAFGLYTPDVMPREEVIEEIKSRIPEYPGVEYRTTWRHEGGEESSLTIMLYGDDTGRLKVLAKEVERRLRGLEEVISVETDAERGSDEIQLRIKRDQAKKYGISPNIIAGTIQYAVRGIPLPKYQTEEKEIDVNIQLREEDRQNLYQLKNLTFFSENGREVPLDAVAEFTIVKGFGEIMRENGKTSLGVKASVLQENMGKIYQKIDQTMAGFELPYGYTWSKGRSFDRMQRSNESQMFAIYLSITFVFILMGILFESFVLPLSVIISIPFSFFGAFWLLYLTGTKMDLMSQIGFIILVGIVVNNAIVLIDLINRLRREGYSRYEAIMEGGKYRFHPILMTAFTTIGGLIPMAVGNAQMIGIPYSPMGRTIIGGLLTSTIISLIAVPWAYTIFDDMGKYFRNLLALFLQKGKKQEIGEIGQAVE